MAKGKQSGNLVCLLACGFRERIALIRRLDCALHCFPTSTNLNIQQFFLVAVLASS
jgi:hypothetical protein